MLNAILPKSLFFMYILSCSPLLFAGAIIDQPGSYKISNDVVYTPTDANDYALFITTSNVQLDFQDYRLSLTTDSTLPNVGGILITNNLLNISIHNANIQNTSGIGIHVLDGCSNVNIINSTIQNCHAAGIFFDGNASGAGITGNVIDGCQVVSCTGASGNAAYGIRIANSSLNRITNSHVALNDSGITNSSYGIYIESSQAFEIKNTTLVAHGGTNVVAGIAIVQSYTGIIQEITTYKNTGRISGTAYGILLDQAQDILISDCKSSANLNSAATAIGFSAQNGKRNIFKNCVAELNTGGTFAAGIQLSAEQNSRIFNCIVQDQKTLSSGTAYGIFLTDNCDLCWVMENRLTNNLGVSSSFGIRDDRSSSTSAVIRNYAFNNGTNYSVSYPLTITLPIITASLSNPLVGIGSGLVGVLDNIDIEP